MEQTIAFVLGVLAVLAVAGVVSMFKTHGQVKDLYEEIEDLQKVINELELDLTTASDLLDRRIDQEIDRVDKLDGEQYKYIDSRTDKMESRLEDTIAKLIAGVYSDMDAKFNDNTGFVDKLFHQIDDLTKKKKNK
jgi:hypothetical protein